MCEYICIYILIQSFANQHQIVYMQISKESTEMK